MKHMLEKYRSTSEEMYQKLSMIDKEHLEDDFDYFKTIADFKNISGSFFLDLDFLSDCMAVSNCYALSRSMNLSQEIRNDLDLYFNFH